jgi:hypothetical protein
MGRALTTSLSARINNTSMTRTTFMIRKAFFAGLAALVLVASANAATVSLFTTTSGNTWQLYAESSAGDNGGIASYNIPMLNIATMTNESPFIQLSSANFQPAGFTELRNPATDSDPAGKTLGASQKLVPTATPNVVYGFGQTGGTVPGGPGLGATRNIDYAAHLLLGSGTWSGTGTAPVPDFAAANMSIVVFGQSGATAVTSASVVPGQPIVPEPATVTLLGLAMVGGFGLVRRRAA